MNGFMDNKVRKQNWASIPPWIIVGAVIILVPIFLFWTFQNVNKQKENTILLLTEKGAALIRSLEAGTRTGMMGMMGMHGGGFRLERLLVETARQPDIEYLVVTDATGKVLAHSDPGKIGTIYNTGLDLESISDSDGVKWRKLRNPDGVTTFEVYRRFSPKRIPFRGSHGMMMHRTWRPDSPHLGPFGRDQKQFIFVGLNMAPFEAARKGDIHHTVIMGVILLLIGFTGIVLLFLAQAYRSTKSSFAQIKAFSDSVVENMPVGLLAISAEGRVAAFNQAAESILEKKAGVIIGKKAEKVLPHQLLEINEELNRGRRFVEREIECILEGGSSVPMDVSASSPRGEEGGIIGNIILFRDLSEVQDLKREVETSRRLASLGRLAAGIAHEIRNPLSSIKGFATYFGERYRNNPEDKKTAEIMIHEVDRLNRVISQLLEFARPLAIQKKPTSLQTLIEHSLKLVQGQAEKRNVVLQKSFSSGVTEALIDPDRINQVLLNLYLNSIEAMEKGGTLSVALSADKELGGVRITVSDTGAGIAKENLEHIFDPYFTTRQSGTGLGLAIVHKIIEAHRGEVKVHSEVGVGTTVSIFLPAS